MAFFSKTPRITAEVQPHLRSFVHLIYSSKDQFRKTILGTSDMSLELTTARTHVSSSLQSSGRAAVQLRPLSARITVEQVPLLSTKGVTNDDVHIEMTDDQC
ncbi:unnamed protein product [Toxocara canis]|uniref:Ubiquitin-like domain-containing protein n=1 Tax=Toxocara canis TaxID=6265 RepID=A0A183U5D2_TOXCA|nr:unnamed protein product [Toxocara canis]